jgi:PAS domain S-box-containing protein
MEGPERASMRRIVVIDDEPEIHKEFERLIALDSQSTGDRDVYDVDHVFGADEGMAKVRDAVDAGRPYAMALVGTPLSQAWDDLDTIEQMWQLDRNLQVVLCTGDSDSAPEKIWRRLGRTDRLFVLRKPFCAMELIQLVRTLAERSRTEKAAHDREERYELATEGADAGLWDWDLETNTLYYSPRWKSMLGYNGEEVGSSLEEWTSRLHPDDAGRATGAAQAFSEGRRNSYEVEFRMRHKDGHYITILSRGLALRNEEGELVRLVGTHVEISERKKIEEALRDSEEKYRSLADSLPIAIFETDLEGRFTFMNRHGLEFTGYTQKDLERGLTTFDVVAPEGHETLQRHMADILRSGGVPPEEYDIVKRDGSTYPATVYARPILGANKPVGMRGVTIDITQRKRAEEALRESEVTFRSIMASAQDGIIAIDNEGKVTLWNEAATRIFGWEADEAIGRNCHELIAPERYAATQQSAFAAFQSSGQGDAMGRVNPLVARHKDGTEFPVELSLASLELQGKWCAVGIVRDTTERERAEEALRENEERLRAILDAVQTGIIVVDPEDHVIKYASPVAERMIGVSRGEMVGKVCHHFVCPDGLGECPVTDLGQTVETSERVLLTANGRKVPILKTVTTVKLGGREHLLESFVDYTELRRVQDELADTHRELVETARRVGMAEVATGVLHNVGNVLNSVGVTTNSMAKLIRDSRTSYLANVVSMLEEHADELAEFITSDERGQRLPAFIAELAKGLTEEQRILLDGVDKLSGHVAHITEVISLQQSYSRGSGMMEPVLLNELVEDAVRMNDQGLLRHSVTVEREYASLPPALFDRSKVLQILTNLINNAKEALTKSGHDAKKLILRIKAPEEAVVRIEVEDNGVGIAPEDLTRIFSFGFTTRKDGHGFGLHSGALAAKEMNGALTAHSDGPGTGSIFVLELPFTTKGGGDEA